MPDAIPDWACGACEITASVMASKTRASPPPRMASKHMECAELYSLCLIVWLAQRQISAGAIAFTSQENHFRWCRRWQLLDAVAHLHVQFALNDQRFDEITRMESAIEQTFRERIFDQALNRAAQRPRA